jgi:serine phosphatase RsbU (regulator of sigma subunit)
MAALTLNEQVEKLLNTEVAHRIVTKLTEDLREQWNMILMEMVSLRKSHVKLEERLDHAVSLDSKLERLIEQAQREQAKTQQLQVKEDRLLSFLIEEFGMKEE